MPSFAANGLVPRLRRFQTQCRDITPTLETSFEPVDLAARPELDSAIRLGRGPWTGLVGEPFLAVEGFAVASPSLIGTLPELRRALDLLARCQGRRKHPTICYRPASAPLHLVCRLCAGMAVTVHGRVASRWMR